MEKSTKMVHARFVDVLNEITIERLAVQLVIQYIETLCTIDSNIMVISHF